MQQLDPNCQWALKMQRSIDQALPIDETTTKSYAAAWLIKKLSDCDRTFKVHNLGAGVKRITTNTDTCPCCKKKL